MSDPFVAEIRIVAFNFAPTGWALCNGQILSIAQNTALFSLLGTIYGGDGKSTFALPDMQGRAPMQYGQGPGLSLHSIGEESGIPAVTLIQTEIPVHTHQVTATNSDAEDVTPTNNAWGLTNSNAATYRSGAETPNTTMSPNALAISGGSLPHNNMQPYLTLNFIIALQGIFPPRG